MPFMAPTKKNRMKSYFCSMCVHNLLGHFDEDDTLLTFIMSYQSSVIALVAWGDDKLN